MMTKVPFYDDDGNELGYCLVDENKEVKETIFYSN